MPHGSVETHMSVMVVRTLPRYHVPHGYMTEQASQMLTVQGVWFRRPCLRRIIRAASVANEQLLFMTGKGTGNSIKFDPS